MFSKCHGHLGVRSEPVSSHLYQSSYFPFSKAKPDDLVEGCFRAAEFFLKGTVADCVSQTHGSRKVVHPTRFSVGYHVEIPPLSGRACDLFL